MLQLDRIYVRGFEVVDVYAVEHGGSRSIDVSLAFPGTASIAQLDDWRFLLIPLLPGTGILCLLVMLGDDLGTTFVLLLIFLGII
mgnify:CR=1 FL=1